MLHVRCINRWLLLGTLCTILACLVPTMRPAHAAPTTSLGDILNPDGTLAARGFSGSLDASGWELVANPDEEPRFVRAAAQSATDDRWDDRWGVPGVMGGVGDIVASVAVDPQGRLYVAGSFTRVSSIEANSIARWDGRRWHALGSGLDGAVKQILLSGTTLYVVGDFTTAGGKQANQIASWNGSAWSTVGSGVGVDRWDGEIRTLATVGASLYVGGEFEAIDGVSARNIARWDGTRWQSLSRGIGDFNFDETAIEEYTGVVSTLLTVQSKLYVGGEFEAVGNPNRLLRANSIAIWDGARWSVLGSGLIRDEWNGPGDVRALAYSGSMLYVGGEFIKANGVLANNIAAWNGTTWSALGNGVRDTADGQTPVRVLMVSGTSLYVGGYFNMTGNKAANALAKWDTSARTWTPQTPALEPNAEVVALARAADGSIVVGGRFDQAGGTWVNNIGRLDATGWRTLGEGLGDFSYSHTGTLNAVAVDRHGRIFVGGEFARAGGVPVKNLAMWDGARWQAIGAVEGRVRALVVSGDDLYVGGAFTRTGGVTASNVARWNRISKQWSALGSGVNGEVRALAYDGTRLYVGGDFTAAGGVAAFDLAYWEASLWRPFGATFRIYERTTEGAEYNTTVHALAVAGKDVIIGGQFQTVHRIGMPTGPIENYRLVNNIVRWNRANDTWSMLGTLSATQEPGVTENGFSGSGIHVNALAIANNTVYVGGTFNQAGTVAASGIAQWKATSNTWAALRAGVGGVSEPEVFALTVIGNDLLVGGHFTTAGSAAANFAARFQILDGTWSTLGSGLMASSQQWTEVYGIAASATSAYFVGDFERAGGKPSFGLAQWNAYTRSSTVPATGGRFASGEGISAEFASGAFAGSTMVTYTSLATTSRVVPTGNIFLRGVTLQAVTGKTPQTTTAKPYTLRIPYSKSWLTATGIQSAASLNVMFWDGTRWNPLLPCVGCTIDTTNQSVTVVTNRLGEFALVGKLP